MRCRVNVFVTYTMIQETWLQSRCLEMDGRSNSDIIRLLAARNNISPFPLFSQGRSPAFAGKLRSVKS
jgi:hypothetical protein